MDLDDLLKERNPPKFTPHAFYCDVGDQIQVYLSDELSTAQYINPYVSIFWDDARTKVLGFEIAGIKQILKNEDQVLRFGK